MTYQTLSSVNATTDVSELLVYVNNLTDGWAMTMMLFFFFLICLIGGHYLQLRIGRDAKISSSFAVAAFLSFGMSVLLSTREGLINWYIVLLMLVISIIGIFWAVSASDESVAP
jgi:hypothetical protein